MRKQCTHICTCRNTAGLRHRRGNVTYTPGCAPCTCHIRRRITYINWHRIQEELSEDSGIIITVEVDIRLRININLMLIKRKRVNEIMFVVTKNVKRLYVTESFCKMLLSITFPSGKVFCLIK